MPQMRAGSVIEPLVSVPTEKAMQPAAEAAAGPADDPVAPRVGVPRVPRSAAEPSIPLGECARRHVTLPRAQRTFTTD